jgi:hypothetical protein
MLHLGALGNIFLLTVPRFESCTSKRWEPTQTAHHVNGLHRMLEDPSYGHVVRWGKEGDSFVVLEVCMQEIKRPRKEPNSAYRMRNLQSPSYLSISSTATLRASFDS